MKEEIIFDVQDERRYNEIKKYLDNRKDIEIISRSSGGAFYNIGNEGSILMINIDNSRTISAIKINRKIYKDISKIINKKIQNEEQNILHNN